MQKHLVRLAQS